jgi:hypothetical protein
LNQGAGCPSQAKRESDSVPQVSENADQFPIDIAALQAQLAAARAERDAAIAERNQALSQIDYPQWARWRPPSHTKSTNPWLRS